MLLSMPKSPFSFLLNPSTPYILPFLFYLFHIDKTVPSFYIWGNKKKVAQGRLGWRGRVGHRGRAVLLNNCWTLSATWAGVLVPNSSWDGQTLWKSLQKNSLKPNTASHNNTSWYSDTDGFLEHSPSRGSLYYEGPALERIILVLFGFPLPDAGARFPMFESCPNIYLLSG